MSVLTPLRARREYRDDVALVDSIAAAWRVAAEAVIGVRVDTVAGASVSVPPLIEVVLTPPVQLLVTMLPGQVVEDYVALAPRIAPHMGARSIRVEPVGLVNVRLTLHTVDPLRASLLLEHGAHERDLVLIGCGEDGDLAVPLDEIPHLAVQGQTRAGKSYALYGLLSQLAPRPGVLVAGVDPTGLLLRPFARTRHASWQCVGPQSAAAVAAAVAQLVAELDRRLPLIPEDHDVLPTDVDTPRIAAVFDEYPSTLARLDASGDKAAASSVRAGMSRLLCESAKVGVSVIVVAQRQEAKVVGADVRAQCAGRISLRVDNLDTLKLLHTPEAAAEHITRHVNAAPGVAVVDWPGNSTRRLRLPTVGDYRRYRQLVAA